MTRLEMEMLRRQECDRMREYVFYYGGNGLGGGFVLGVLAQTKDWASREGWERDKGSLVALLRKGRWRSCAGHTKSNGAWCIICKRARWRTGQETSRW